MQFSDIRHYNKACLELVQFGVEEEEQMNLTNSIFELAGNEEFEFKNDYLEPNRALPHLRSNVAGRQSRKKRSRSAKVDCPKLLNFHQVFTLLRSEVESSERKESRKFFRIRNLRSELDPKSAKNKKLPLIMVARMKSIEFKDKTFYMISFTEVGLMIHRSKQELESSY